jgi:hypothetical protein
VAGDYHLFTLLDYVKQLTKFVLRLEGADLAQKLLPPWKLA